MRHLLATAVALLCAPTAIACDSEKRCDPTINADATLCDADTVDCRPYTLHVPQAAKQPLDLLVFLHGYGGNGESNLEHLDLQDVAEERGWLLASPTGTLDAHDCNTWNVAGYGSGRDDGAYLDALIADVRGRHAVARIMVLGYSMGGSFAFQYACDRPTTVDAVASLAGRVPSGLECPTPSAATLLAIGDEDQGFPGASNGDFLSARDSINRLAILNECTSGPVVTGRVRTLVAPPASEVVVLDYGGCTAETELWTQGGVDHSLGGRKPGAVDSTDVLEFLQGPLQQ